mgnify:FL=1
MGKLLDSVQLNLFEFIIIYNISCEVEEGEFKVQHGQCYEDQQNQVDM